MSTFVYKDEKDIKIEQLVKDNSILMQKLTLIAEENKKLNKNIDELKHNSKHEKKINETKMDSDILKKQNELYRQKINEYMCEIESIRVKSVDNQDNNKINSMVSENIRLNKIIDQCKTEIEFAKKQNIEYEKLKKELADKTENILKNEKIVFLTQEIEKIKSDVENSDKVKMLVENNQELKMKMKKIIDHNKNTNNMQIQKLLTDRKKNITELIKKQRKIEHLLQFITKHNLMTKLIAY